MSVGVTLINQAFNIAASSQVTVLAQAVVTSVPGSTETTIVTLAAAPAGDNHFLTQINASGQVYGKYRVFFNSTLKYVLRGGSDRNAFLLFTFPVRVPDGEAVDVKVEHFASTTEDFEATITGFTG